MWTLPDPQSFDGIKIAWLVLNELLIRSFGWRELGAPKFDGGLTIGGKSSHFF